MVSRWRNHVADGLLGCAALRHLLATGHEMVTLMLLLPPLLAADAWLLVSTQPAAQGETGAAAAFWAATPSRRCCFHCSFGL